MSSEATLELPVGASPNVWATAALDALPLQAAVLDDRGTILAINTAWRTHAFHASLPVPTYDVGCHYQQICEDAAKKGSPYSAGVAEGLTALLRGERESFAIEYSTEHLLDPSANEVEAQIQYFELRVARILGAPPAALLAVHEEITARKAAERELVRGREDLEARVVARTAELTRSEKLHRNVIESLPGGVFHLASNGAFLDSNTEGLRYLGLTMDMLLKQHIPSFAGITFHEDGSPCPVEDYPASQCLATGQPQGPLTIGLRRPDGSMGWAVFTAVPVECPIVPGRSGTIVMFLNITERKNAEDALRRSEEALKQAHADLELRVIERTRELATINQMLRDEISGRIESEEKLRESEARFRQMAEHIGEVIWIVDADTHKMLYISPAYETLWGRSCESVYKDGHSFLQAVIPEDMPIALHCLERQRYEPFDAVYRICGRDGEIRWVRSRSTPIRDSEGRVRRVSGIAEDITDLKRAEEEVLQISERERRRIGQDLHDGLGQHLTGIAFLSKSLQQRLAQKAANNGVATIEESEEATRVYDLVQQAVVQTRTLARGLHPVEPSSTGLTTALGELASSTNSYSKIQCQFVCSHTVPISDNIVATHLYRIAQEAVNNALKHAKPRHIRISLGCDSDNQLRLTVEDDGTGMTKCPITGAGLGLRIMRYRAKMIDGILTVGDGSKGGTAVSCSVACPGPCMPLPIPLGTSAQKEKSP